MITSSSRPQPAVRRKIFVSYHHRGDQHYFDAFLSVFHDALEIITDNSLDRQIDSSNPEYIMRRIREHHLHGSSCTIVLCGADTWRRKYVDWEIKASLDQGMGLVGVWLPTLPLIAGGTTKPARLQDNIDSNYAIWTKWDSIAADPGNLVESIEYALHSSRSNIANERPMLSRNH